MANPHICLNKHSGSVGDKSPLKIFKKKSLQKSKLAKKDNPDSIVNLEKLKQMLKHAQVKCHEKTSIRRKNDKF